MLQISLFLICIFELLLFSTLRSNAVNIYNLNFTIRFDNYPQEINWTIISLNEGDQVVFSGNGYNATKYETVNDNSLITDGCFKLIIYDSFGDGMFSKQNWGWFTLYLNDTEITLGKQTFDDSQTHLTFCTQLFATNTNTTSNYSNGYNEINITFFNYNSEIIIKDSNNSDTIYYDNVYEIMEQHSTSTTAILIMSDGCYDISFVNSFIDSNDAILHVSVNGSPMITTSTAQSRYLADICLIGWPNWYISTIDYMFDVGVNGNFKSSHKLEIEFEPSYNCGSGSGGGCSYSINTTKKWYINGDCDKGKVAIMIIYKSFSYINLYVNEIYFGQMSNINYDYEYSLNQSDTDYSNGGGYLEIKLQNDNLNAHNIYDSMWLDGFIYVSCDLYPNVTTADPTVNPTHYPTLQPTWDINAADYYWDVASADNEIGVVLFTESQPLTCKKNTTDCEASEMFLIEGECLYPWMSIEVVETDFDASNEFVSIYVNHEYVGMCDALDDECGDELVPCKEGNIYELGDYFNTGANAATDYTNVIVVSLIVSDDVNHCNYKGYSLYASVTLGCFNYKNVSGNNLTNIRICNKTNDCNNEILSDFDIIYCLDSFSCSNITVYNAHSVWCHYNYSCINSHFEKIDFLTCYGTSSCMDSRIDSVNSVTCDGSSSCKNAHFSGVEYDGIKCTTYDSCVNAKGELYTCKGYYDFICPIDEICGYTQELSAYCNVFCYGECFAASETKLKGIPHRKDYLYPLYHICIPWYLYLVYLLPYVLFWLYFDYYFNLYLAEKFNTILLLFDEEFDLLNLGDENISRQNKQENDMHIDLPSVKENHIGRLKCLLYGSEDKNGSAESKWDFIVNQSKLSGKMDKLESRVSAVYNNPNRYFVYSDTYIWSIFCGGGSKYRFKFSYNDIMSAQDDWIHKTKIDVIPTVDVIIPDEIWNIIFDFCRVVYDVIQLNSNENVNLKQLSENEVGLALHFIKYVYLKPQYFDHYAIMCKMLSWYALFEFIKEFVVLICILICFFTSNIKKENWQSYEQFVSILMNFYYGPLNPMFIFYIVHYSFNNLFKCCGIDTITRQHKRLEEVKTKNNNKNNNNNNNDNNETISISQQYNLSMHQCPSAMKKLLVYYFVKYWMVGLVIVLPFLFVAVLTITCILMWSFCCCKGTTYCVPFLYKKEVQISKIIFYIWMFATVMNSIFCWINIYDGHMWVAAIGRSFLAIDQCPNYFNRNDNYQFDNVFEFIVWLNYWLV